MNDDNNEDEDKNETKDAISNEVESRDDYYNLNESIVQHNVFNVGDTVIYVPSKSTRPWKIKEIDNSKKSDNIVIFSLLMGDLSDHNDLPPKTVIQEKVLNKSTQTWSTPVFLTVSIADILHYTKDEKINKIAIKDNIGRSSEESYIDKKKEYENNEYENKEQQVKKEGEEYMQYKDSKEESIEGEENSEIKQSGSIKTIKLN